MNKEKEIISTISGLLPRSRNQLNDLFESDSEILQFGNKKLLFTVDEYLAGTLQWQPSVTFSPAEECHGIMLTA